MVDESGYESGSKDSPFTSDLSLSDSAKKPCEICGSLANEDEIMTCFRCRDTREHTYCARVMLQRVPHIWLCEECRCSSSIVQLADKTANAQVREPVDDSIEATQLSRSNQVEEVVVKQVPNEVAPSSRTKQVVDNKDYIDQTAPSSRTKQVVDNKDYIDQTAPSRTHQAVNNEDWTEAAPSSSANQVEQVVPVVPHIHQYSTNESTPGHPIRYISPCSLVFKPMCSSYHQNTLICPLRPDLKTEE